VVVVMMFKSYYPYLALLLIDGFGPGEIAELLKRSTDRPVELFQKLQTKKGRQHLSAQLGRAIGDIPWDRFDAQLQAIGNSGTGVVSIADPDFPSYLKEINNPPLILFYRGRLSALHHRGVGMVGTRKPSPQGAAFSRSLSRDLSKLGVMIVSGLARGIDSASHQGALEGSAPTVGVIGTGIDIVYPPENRELTAQVASQGCVVSELLMGYGPQPFTFPQRNRLISALARIIIVVEAGPRSGALITARWAIEQGREVGAVPGFPGDFRSRGVNRLLKSGAVVVENVNDVLRAVPLLQDSFLPAGWTDGTVSQGQGPAGKSDGPVGRDDGPAGPGTVGRCGRQFVPEDCSSQNASAGSRPALPAEPDFGSRQDTWSGDEASEVFGALSAKPVAPDTLAGYLKKSICVVQSVLLELEVRGLVRRDHSGCYYRLTDSENDKTPGDA
jgi:DNA processing protein